MAAESNHNKDKNDFDYIMNSIKKAGFVYNERILQYSYFKGPWIKDKVWDDLYLKIHQKHLKLSHPHSNDRVADVEQRIEMLKSFASGTLAYHGHDEFRLLVPPPLLMECTILILNGKDVDIGRMLLDRIAEEEEDLEEVKEYYARMVACLPYKKNGGKNRKKGKK